MKQENFSIPPEVAELLAEVLERHPEWKTRKWWLYVAALLDLLAKGDAETVARVKRIASAAAGGELGRLAKEAREAAADEDLPVTLPNQSTVPSEKGASPPAAPPSKRSNGAGRPARRR